MVMGQIKENNLTCLYGTEIRLYGQLKDKKIIHLSDFSYNSGMTKACPSDYDLIGDSCYKFYNQTSTQSEATRFCKNDGAFLASAESELEDINEIHAGWVFKGLYGQFYYFMLSEWVFLPLFYFCLAHYIYL